MASSLSPTQRRPQRLQLGDYLLALGCALTSVPYVLVAIHPGDVPPMTATAQMLLAWTLTVSALFWRTHPKTAGIYIAIFLALWAFTFWQALPVHTGFTPYIVLAGVVIYAWVRWLESTAWKVAAALLALVGAVISPANALPTAEGIRYDFPSVLIQLLAISFIWLLARHHRAQDFAQEKELREAEERRIQRERETEQKATLAIHQERTRIASEIHDILAHSLTLVHARSTAGIIVGKTDPEEALKALEDVRESASSALGQMRTLVKSLHSSEHPTFTGPTGDLRDISLLVERFQASGLDVVANLPSEAELARAQEQLPLLTRLAVMRVLEEGLTNALRYGATNQPMQLDFSCENPLKIRVLNKISPDYSGVSLGTGTGLLGLADRVKSLGGTLNAESHADTFELTASLPFTTVAEQGKNEHDR